MIDGGSHRVVPKFAESLEDEVASGDGGLPQAHATLLERYAAGLRYVYGERHQVLSYARQHVAPYPQLPDEPRERFAAPAIDTTLSEDSESLAPGVQIHSGIGGVLSATAHVHGRNARPSPRHKYASPRRGLLQSLAASAKDTSVLRNADSASSVLSLSSKSSGDLSTSGTLSPARSETNLKKASSFNDAVKPANHNDANDSDNDEEASAMSSSSEASSTALSQQVDDDDDETSSEATSVRSATLSSSSHSTKQRLPASLAHHQLSRGSNTVDLRLSSESSVSVSPSRNIGIGAGAGGSLNEVGHKMGGPLWGRSLDAGCAWGHVRHATPVVLQRTVHYLNTHKHALHTEGLFRIAGNHRLLESLRRQFDSGVDVDLSATCGDDVHTVASLLINYLRHVSPPLIVTAQRARFVRAARVPVESRLQYIRVLLSLLPPSHQRSLDLLCSFLHRVAVNHQETHMDIRNLAMVFGPCILRQAQDNDDPMAVVLETTAINEVVALLIEEHEKIFGLSSDVFCEI